MMIEPSVDLMLARARRATKGAESWLVPLFRAGYAARGVVYCLTGVIAGLGAAGRRGEAPDSDGVLRLVMARPFGKVLLIILAVGLGCFATWSLFRAALDPEREGAKPRGWMKRIGYFFTGMFYLALVWVAGQIWRGSVRRASSNQQARYWVGELMRFPAGRWLVAGVGVGLLVYLAMQVRRALGPLAEDQMALGAEPKKWVKAMARFGIVSRAIVFGIAGVFLLVSAIDYDPNRARGLGGALGVLRREPAGPLVLGVVSFGLIAYGSYDLVLAKCRVIRLRGS